GHCKKRIGNGRDTCFWYDKWLGDKPLKDLFPRLFALELNKEVTVADKVQGVVSSSFRRPVRAGPEYQHLTDLNSLMESVSLSHSCDKWICDLSGDGEFRVKEHLSSDMSMVGVRLASFGVFFGLELLVFFDSSLVQSQGFVGMYLRCCVVVYLGIQEPYYL
nr:RNA-directed DNA polymerase, eukaryota, reverse transcriptase zinc-binding domain protein [Tanacetum cinerariifolium]